MTYHIRNGGSDVNIWARSFSGTDKRRDRHTQTRYTDRQVSLTAICNSQQHHCLHKLSCKCPVGPSASSANCCVVILRHIAMKIKQIVLQTKDTNWLIGKKLPSIYIQQITHLQSANQT